MDWFLYDMDLLHERVNDRDHIQDPLSDIYDGVHLRRQLTTFNCYLFSKTPLKTLHLTGSKYKDENWVIEIREKFNRYNISQKAHNGWAFNTGNIFNFNPLTAGNLCQLKNHTKEKLLKQSLIIELSLKAKRYLNDISVYSPSFSHFSCIVS